MSAIRQREKDLRARAAELGVKIPNEFQNWDYYYRSFDSFAEAFEEWLDNIQNGIVTAEPLIDFDREPTMSEKQQLREELRETQNNWRNKSGYQQGQQFRLENENVIGFRGYVSQPLTLARPAPSGTIGGQHVM